MIMVFKAKVYGGDEIIESRSLLRSENGDVFLAAPENKSIISHYGVSDACMGDILSIESVDENPVFVRVDPETLG